MDGENSSSGKGRNLTYLLILILIIIVLALLAGGFYIGHDKINKLARSLEHTQKQVENVKEQSDENKENIAKDAVSGVKNTADAIKDVDNPVVRLALAKVYAANLRSLLPAARQTDLDAVMVYVNDNPKVLITKNPVLPKEVALAVSNLKTAARNLKVAGVATMQKIDKELYTQGEIVNLTGTISYVGDDTDLNGGIFTLTDSKTGYVYYFEFNEANSQVIENTMNNKLVTVQIKVTSKANEPLTFQVLKGPTLVPGVTQSVSPKTSPTAAPTQTQITPTP